MPRARHHGLSSFTAGALVIGGTWHSSAYLNLRRQDRRRAQERSNGLCLCVGAALRLAGLPRALSGAPPSRAKSPLFTLVSRPAIWKFRSSSLGGPLSL